MRRERLYLEDIPTAADAIAEFTYAQNLESFETNLMLRSAVVQQLTVIGEAVAHLSEGLRGRSPEIPWAGIKGFRNIIVHNYFGIDWAEVGVPQPRGFPSCAPRSPISCAPRFRIDSEVQLNRRATLKPECQKRFAC